MNDIESRITALERTNRRYRVGLATSLAALCLVVSAGFGQVGPGQGQQTYPRIIVCDSITTQSLNAYTGTISQLGTNNATVQYMSLADGRAENLTLKNTSIGTLQAQRAALGPTTCNRLDVTGPNRGAGLLLAPTQGGGIVQVLDDQGQPLAALGSRDGGGVLGLYGKGGFLGVEGSTDDKAGVFRMFNNIGKTLAVVERAKTGDGVIAVGNRNGNRMVELKSDDSGRYGRFAVNKEGGIPLVKIEADEKGGSVQTMDEKSETARIPSK